MSKKSILVAVIVAVGFVLIGVELGRYLALSRSEQGRYVTYSTGPPPSPKIPAPAYPGPRPQAKFETPRSPAKAASSPSAEPPRDAILDALREPRDFARAARLAELLPTLGPEAVPDVRAVLDDPSIEFHSVEGGLLLRFWATHDPAHATIWAATGAPPGYRSGAFDVTYDAWAKVDPEAARKQLWAMALAKPEGFVAGERALVRGWFESGVPGLEDYIQGLGTSVEQQRALSMFARYAIRRDGPEPIARWAESISDEDKTFKQDAFRKLAAELALADPAAARAWCDAHCDGPFGNNVRALIAERWATYDGPAAMQWLSTAPERKERNWAVREAYRAWSRADRKGLTRWLSAMGPEGVEPWMQPAVALFAVTTGRRDPVQGMQWAAAITDDARREGVMIAIARSWREADASAAEAWLAQSPLSEEAREKVRAPKKPRRQRPKKRCPCPEDSISDDATSEDPTFEDAASPAT